MWMDNYDPNESSYNLNQYLQHMPQQPTADKLGVFPKYPATDFPRVNDKLYGMNMIRPI